MCITNICCCFCQCVLSKDSMVTTVFLTTEQFDAHTAIYTTHISIYYKVETPFLRICVLFWKYLLNGLCFKVNDSLRSSQYLPGVILFCCTFLCNQILMIIYIVISFPHVVEIRLYVWKIHPRHTWGKVGTLFYALPCLFLFFMSNNNIVVC